MDMSMARNKLIIEEMKRMTMRYKSLNPKACMRHLALLLSKEEIPDLGPTEYEPTRPRNKGTKPGITNIHVLGEELDYEKY